MSLIDVKHLTLEMTFVEGESLKTVDPLGGGGFDLADISVDVENARVKLDSSPFLRVWSDDLEKKFSQKKGIWLFYDDKEGDEFLHLKYTIGSKTAIDATDGYAFFFSVPENLYESTQKLFLTVVCCN